MILVLGSTGTVGSEVVRELLEMKQPIRAAYHSRKPTAPGVQTVRVDLESGEGLAAAMDGADTVFLLAGELPDQTAAEIRAVEAAKRAGVRRLVKLSVFGAEGENYSFARIHRPIERAVEASGIPYTLLRPVNFMQNFATHYADMIRNQSAIFLPYRDGRDSFVDARDIARVAAVTLTEDGHAGKAYDLCGPELLTYSEAAAKISNAIGRKISYVNISDDDFRHALSQMGVPADYAERLVDLCRFVREGGTQATSTAIRDVTAREPTRFDDFARDYARAWLP